MDDKEIRRIQCFLTRGEHQDLCESDLIVRDGVPIVVLEWQDPLYKEQPSVYLPLDPAHLKAPAKADGVFQYSAPLADPRKPE